MNKEVSDLFNKLKSVGTRARLSSADLTVGAIKKKYKSVSYSDDVIVKKYDTCDKYFCCTDCLAEYENAVRYLSDDSEYDKLFGINNI